MKKHEVRVLIRTEDPRVQIEHRPRIAGVTEKEAIDKARAVWKDCLVWSVHSATKFAGWRY